MTCEAVRGRRTEVAEQGGADTRWRPAVPFPARKTLKIRKTRRSSCCSCGRVAASRTPLGLNWGRRGSFDDLPRNGPFVLGGMGQVETEAELAGAAGRAPVKRHAWRAPRRPAASRLAGARTAGPAPFGIRFQVVTNSLRKVLRGAPVVTGRGGRDAAGPGWIRASDAERERVVELVKAAFIAGLLTRGELGQRVGGALTARTHADLARVSAGIPASVAAPAPPAPGPASTAQPARRAGEGRRLPDRRDGDDAHRRRAYRQRGRAFGERVLRAVHHGVRGGVRRMALHTRHMSRSQLSCSGQVSRSVPPAGSALHSRYSRRTAAAATRIVSSSSRPASAAASGP